MNYESLKQQIHDLISNLPKTNESRDIENIRSEYLGKSGIITAELKKLAEFDVEERKIRGAEINAIKVFLVSSLDEKLIELEAQMLNKILESEKIDVTLPPRPKKQGNVHIISKVIKELIDIFNQLGFATAKGPEIEDDFYNFAALNIPENHPARRMHDTFYLENGKLLRTHTSSVQIRAMQGNKAPFKFISPGRVYRCDYDATHSPMFHQIEGVHIEKNLSMADLKGCLELFLEKFFVNKQIKVRLRPSYFPFTSPSAEVDISLDGGKKWLEVLGSGIIHPNVLKNIGVNPDEYSGFAFGMGVERLAMLKYGVTDLREFFEYEVKYTMKNGFSFFEY
jgi:phenylalanyl-tRNA synthetase alpha chain